MKADFHGTPAQPDADLFVGVDNGLLGGIAAVDRKGTVVALFDMPVCQKDKGNGRRLDPEGVVSVIQAVMSVDDRPRHPVWAIEQYLTMRTAKGGEQVTNAQALAGVAWSHGIWAGALTALGQPWMSVWPQTWQARVIPGARGRKAVKSAAVETAGRLSPRMAEVVRGPCGGAKDGRADAFLIAEWLRQAWRHDNLIRQAKERAS